MNYASINARLRALEARIANSAAPHRSKAERDALAASALSDPGNEAKILASRLPVGEAHRRAAVEAAFRVDA